MFVGIGEEEEKYYDWYENIQAQENADENKKESKEEQKDQPKEEAKIQGKSLSNVFFTPIVFHICYLGKNNKISGVGMENIIEIERIQAEEEEAKAVHIIADTEFFSIKLEDFTFDSPDNIKKILEGFKKIKCSTDRCPNKGEYFGKSLLLTKSLLFLV